MSINGIMNQPMTMFRPEMSPEDKAQAAQAEAAAAPPADVINIKAMKAILYLGIKGDISLPLDAGRTVDTLA